MEITIKGSSKEIAALVLELQERQVLEGLADDVVSHLKAVADRIYTDPEYLMEAIADETGHQHSESRR